MLRLVDAVVAQQTPTLSKAPQTLYWLAGLCFPGIVFLSITLQEKPKERVPSFDVERMAALCALLIVFLYHWKVKPLAVEY